MRTETAARLAILEEQYWNARDGQDNKAKTIGAEASTPVAQGTKSSGILKGKNQDSLAKPKFDYKNLKKGKSGGGSPTKSKSRSKSRKKSIKSISPP